MRDDAPPPPDDAPPPPDNSLQLAAEARKAELDALLVETTIAKTRAETAKFKAEARQARAVAERAEAELAVVLRKTSRDLATNVENRTYDFVDSVSSASTEKCIAWLATWARQSAEPITIRFTSPGGAVIEGFALFDYIQSLRAQGIHVTTMTLGMAASMAAILLQAGDERVMGRNAVVLIHELSSHTGGKVGEIEDDVAFFRMLNKRLFTILASRSSLTLSEIETRARRKDYWLGPEDAVALGFADRIA